MGNSNTKSKSNSNSSAGHTNTKLMSVEELYALVAAADTSTKEDPSFHNVLSWFTKLLRRPDLEGFNAAVNAMKDNWKRIFKALNQLSSDSANDVNNEDVKTMTSIYNAYWKLLLRTGSVMSILIKKCELQQRNVRLFLGIIDKCCQLKDGEELSSQDAITLRECKNKLAKWLTNDELSTLLTDWVAIQKQLQDTQLTWTEKCKKVKQGLKGSLKKNYFLEIAACVGIVVLLAGSVTAIVLTCGIAAPVVITADFIILKAVLISGAVVLGGVAAYSAHEVVNNIWQAEKGKTKAIRLMNDVAKTLKLMMANTRIIQMKLHKVQAHQCSADADYKDSKDSESYQKIKLSLNTIYQHLEDYISDGQQVMQTVDKACKQMINS